MLALVGLRIKWLVLVFFLATPAVALGEAADLETARAMIDRQEYDAGLEAFDGAIQSGELTREQLIAAYRGQAECAAALRQPDRAFEAFRRLLVVDPDYFLSTNESPLLREPFERAQLYWRENEAPRFDFEPPTSIPAGEAFAVEINLDRTTIPGVHDSLRLHLRHPDGRYIVREIPNGRLLIPAAVFEDLDVLQFYITLHDEYGNTAAMAGSEDAPLAVDIGERLPSDSSGDRERRVWYRSWWFWTIVGVAVTAVAVGVPVGVASSESDDPCVQAVGGPCDVTIDFGL